MKNTSKFLSAFIFSVVAATAQASVVSSLPGSTAVAIPAVDRLEFFGPATLSSGVVFTSSVPAAFGWQSDYGFNNNGNWSGAPMIGTNRETGFFTLSFTGGVSGFLADVNWTTFSAGDASMQAFDSLGNLLESLTLEHNGANLVDPGYHGFSRAGNDIASIRFSEEYIGIRDLSITRATDVPEPASIALMGLGLAGFAAARRKSAKK